MWPTWHQVGFQNGAKMEKIDAEIHQQIDASWDRFLEGFAMFLVAKMEPYWHPHRLKMDVICEKRIFEKSLFFL